MGKNKRKRTYLPERREQKTSSIKLSASKTTVSVSPIPPANELEAYNNIRPDLGSLIIQDWQENSKTRRSILDREMKVKEKALLLDTFKVVAVIVFMITMLGLSAYLAYNKQYELATMIILSPLLIGIIDAIKQKR